MKIFAFLKKYAIVISIIQATIWPIILIFQVSQMNLKDLSYNPSKVDEKLMHSHDKLEADHKTMLEVIRIYGRQSVDDHNQCK